MLFSFKSPKILWAFIGFLIILFPVLFVFHTQLLSQISDEVVSYLDLSYKTERQYIEKYPIYEDYSTPQKESLLRTHLLMDHLREAEKRMKPVESEEEIQKLVEQKKLEFIETGKDHKFYFYNVPKQYRYLTPDAHKGLLLVSEKFQEIFHEKSDVPIVKIAISSAIRPQSYQKKLRNKNINASFTSSHSYGVSFDIFYDDFFVDLPYPQSGNAVSQKIQEKLRTRLGFVMGDALSRQFRSVLMETLIRLQEEGKIYAILEKNQRCYHVTVLNPL